ncbi:unnamed protein product [Prunus brigantina]
MRYNKSKIAILIVFVLLLEGVLMVHVRTTSKLKQYSSRPSSSSGSVFFKIWNFNYRSSNQNSSGNGRNLKLKHRRFSNHGFFRSLPAADEEQKRITPNGANPLHNR